MILNFSKQLESAQKKIATEALEVADEVTEADFIPYAIHYDPETLLTKNGELLKTIRVGMNIVGDQFEIADKTGVYLRDILRNSILAHIKESHFSFWVHTFRRRQAIDTVPDFEEPLAGYIDDAWYAANEWDFQYYNEVYITILREGQSAELFDFNDFKKGFITTLNQRFRKNHIVEAHQDLCRAVDAIRDDIAKYFEADVLGFVERRLDEVYLLENAGDGPQTSFFSEPLEFMGKIVNLESTPIMVKNADLSQVISGDHELTFGFNALESRAHTGRRRYAGLLTLKAYTELHPDSLDLFLQLPHEYIITQSFSFCSAEEALERHMLQKDVLETSGEFATAAVSGLEEMLASDMGQPVDFGKLQTNIMVIVDDFHKLDEQIRDIQNALSSIGLLVIREEIRFEECFWAQLPGNFEFIRRQRPINTARTGGLARLNHFPSGQLHGNHWGDAVSILPTVLRTPYFFNFHHEDCGHTAVFDFNSFVDTVGTTMVNFLLAQSRKFGGQLFIFDQLASASLFVNKIRGSYHQLQPDRESKLTPMRLNPFLLEDSKRNRAFLLAWMVSLIQQTPEENETLREQLRPYVEKMFALPQEQRNLLMLVELLNDDDLDKIADRFEPWHDDNKFGGIFDSGIESLTMEGDIHGMDLTYLSQNPDAVIPVFSYLLHRAISQLDGRPAIFVFHEAWLLMDNDFFQPRLKSLLEMMNQNNAMAIFYTRRVDEYVDRHMTQLVLETCATRLYIPDDVGADYFGEILNITPYEAKRLARMDRQKGGFLIKHASDSIFAMMDLDAIMDVRSILANDSKTLANTGGPFA